MQLHPMKREIESSKLNDNIKFELQYLNETTKEKTRRTTKTRL